MKRLLLFFSPLLFFIFCAQSLHAQYKLTKVVIDAGHGGKDPGAIGAHSKEKDIALAIALKTGAYIEKYIPDVKVIYTRKTDVFVELYKRAEIANENKADLFISIHCNAVKSTATRGTETFVMGLHKSAANLEVAKLENQSILKEENYSNMYEGFDPNQDEDYITLTMFQDAFLEQSTLLADKIQQQFRERVHLKDRGVWQAGFLVLYKTAMAGVLVETGFITNSSDERFLMSDEGQSYIASGIYRAFKQYKQELEREDNKAKPVSVSESEQAPAPSPDIFFRVQFLSSKSRKNLDSKKFDGIKDVREYHQDGYYKYTSGNETDLDEAIKLQNIIRHNKKYRDAFVVAFRNGQRISMDDAMKLIKK